MKKSQITWFLLVLVLCLALCVGCAPAEPAPAEPAPAEPAPAEPAPAEETPAVVLEDLILYTDGSPGAAGDNIIRSLGEIITAQTGINITYENITGGNGANCMTAMMNNKKGYGAMTQTCTFCLTILDGTSPYDLEDMSPVVSIATDYNVIVTSPDSQFKTFEEIVAYARANPGELNWGANGSKGSQQLFEQLIVDELGLDISYIPYDSANNAKVAVIAGDIDVCTATAGNMVSDIAAGVYHGIAVSSPERYEKTPDMPTIADCGLSGGADGNAVWRGFICPRSYGDDVIQYIAEVIENAKASDEWAEFLSQNNMTRWDLNYEEFNGYVDEYLIECADAVAMMK